MHAVRKFSRMRGPPTRTTQRLAARHGAAVPSAQFGPPRAPGLLARGASAPPLPAGPPRPPRRMSAMVFLRPPAWAAPWRAMTRHPRAALRKPAHPGAAQASTGTAALRGEPRAKPRRPIFGAPSSRPGGSNSSPGPRPPPPPAEASTPTPAPFPTPVYIINHIRTSSLSLRAARAVVAPPRQRTPCVTHFPALC